MRKREWLIFGIVQGIGLLLFLILGNPAIIRSDAPDDLTVHGTWRTGTAWIVPEPTVTPTPNPLLLAVYSNMTTEGRQDFTDSSVSAHTLNAAGNAQHSIEQQPDGYTSSMKFVTNGDYVTTAASSDFDFGTGDFTIDFLMFLNATGMEGVDRAMIRQRFNYRFLVTTSLRPSFEVNDGEVTVTGDPVAKQEWLEINISRVGNQLGVQVDGVPTYGNVSGIAIGSDAYDLYLGGYEQGEAWWDTFGYLNRIRVYKGVSYPQPTPVP